MIQSALRQLLTFTLLVALFTSCKELDKSSPEQLSSFSCSVDCKGFSEDETKHKHEFTDGESVSVSLGNVIPSSPEENKVVLLDKKHP